MYCSICINTYKRPELLGKLLHSLLSQELNENITLEIIIVDNDPLESGKNIVDKIGSTAKFPIIYFSQPIKNIAITRNKAVWEAKGEYIFFIDDDAYADPNWVKNILNCLLKYNADGVFGKVVSYFDDNTPDWIKKNQIFHRQIQLTGTTSKYTRTTNCLIKTSILKSVDGPFNVKYGITGGSDSHLFSILSNRGAKFVDCEESIVYEYVPSERANLKWLIKRSFRTGNSFARRAIELASHKLLYKSYLLIKAVIFISLYILLYLLTFFLKQINRNYLVKIPAYIGHICAAFNYYYEEYR